RVTSDHVDETVSVVYERDGRTEEVPVTLTPRYQWFVSRVAADTPPAEAGLEVGDEIVAIDGTDLSELDDPQSMLEDLEGETVPITYLGQDDEQPQEAELEVRNLMLQGNQVL